MSSEKTSLDALRIHRKEIPADSGRSWLLPGLALVVALAGGVWWFTRDKVPVVETITVSASKTASSGSAGKTLLNGSGYVTARRAATVSAKVTGKVTEILVEEGMKVEEGQILARLDNSNVQESLLLAEAQLQSARRTLEETRPNLAFAQQEVKRFADLVASKATSISDFNRAEAQARSLEATLARQEADIVVAERQVGTWKLQVDDNIIRAPFNGVVTSKDAQPGEIISPVSAGGGFTRTGICTIVDMTSLEIEVDVNESYINRVQTGQTVEATLDAYSDWRIPAKVIAIIPTADRQKATVKVRVGFDQLDPRILPEMGVKVAFQSTPTAAPQAPAQTGRSTPSIAVPKAAVHDVDGRTVVWIVREGRVERRAVTVSQTVGEESTITAGLSSGERIVTKTSQPLADGGRVTESESPS